MVARSQSSRLGLLKKQMYAKFERGVWMHLIIDNYNFIRLKINLSLCNNNYNVILKSSNQNQLG